MSSQLSQNSLGEEIIANEQVRIFILFKFLAISKIMKSKIGLIATSLNRFGVILNSVQSDVMQVSKAVKEASLESKYPVSSVERNLE